MPCCLLSSSLSWPGAFTFGGASSRGFVFSFVFFSVYRWLREHQRQGVQFLFDCLMGLKEFHGEGCILADDMGLGKTLQSISILWTLLEQGILNDGKPGQQGHPVPTPPQIHSDTTSRESRRTHPPRKERLPLTFSHPHLLRNSLSFALDLSV